MQLVGAESILNLWLKDKFHSQIWSIVIFFFIPFIFNNLNVRRYGEVEYVLTVIKVATIVGIIIMGILLSMGASAKTRMLATNLTNTTVEMCLEPNPDDCSVGVPGFGCMVSLCG